MKFEAITIKDIAKALGISPSSVSRALRDSHEIGDNTKKRVREYAALHNYRPNPVALSLKERKTGSIGVVVSEIANTFFSQAIDGIESIAYNNSCNVIITQSKESSIRENMILDYLKSRSVDGMIVSVAAETEDYSHFTELNAKGLPIVFFDRIIEEINTHKVTIDDFKGAYDATVHLVKSGFRNIAVIANNKNLSITRERVLGFTSALQDNGLKQKNDLIQYCKHGGLEPTEVDHVIRAFLSREDPPDAILTLADKLSLETLRFLKLKKIKIPEQIALIGFCNSNITELTDPPLSIICQPAFEMGQIAATKLLELIKSKRAITQFETAILLPEIIIRKSSQGRL